MPFAGKGSRAWRFRLTAAETREALHEIQATSSNLLREANYWASREA